ncbi:MAG: hypothetical protein WA373_10950 [Burkholderiales bacterium]
MNKADKEFQEIAHCGGQITIDTKTDERGHRLASFGVRHSSPTAAAWFMLWANPLGEPIATVPIGGLADPPDEPAQAPPGFQIILASDSEGMFGHECPRCRGYWRSRGAPALWPMSCPYCRLRTGTHNFRTVAQRKFIHAVCAKFEEVIQSDFVGETVIDMDAVAAAVASEEKPQFYYAEQRQQNQFTCTACNGQNDILGRYGFCSLCGTHNGLEELQADLARARTRIDAGESYEGALSDIVSAFDSYARQLAKRLAQIPMRRQRREALETRLFHNIKPRAAELKAWFDVDLFDHLSDADIEFVHRMFCRRHVYEHNGGEVDERYMKESGDTTVRPKQHLRETAESAGRLADLVEVIGKNLKVGFDDIFPAESKPLQYEARRQTMMKAR